MVSASTVFNCILRFLQVCCSAVAAGVLGEYVAIINHTTLSPESRIVYALSVACISIFFSMVLFFPFPKFYLSFPFDLCMGSLLIVAASILLALTSGSGCHSTWYVSHWGWAWGGWWRRVPSQVVTADEVAGAGCGSWKASIGFLFIAGMFWWGSVALGLCVMYERRRQEKHQAQGGINEGEDSAPVGSGGIPVNKERASS